MFKEWLAALVLLTLNTRALPLLLLISCPNWALYSTSFSALWVFVPASFFTLKPPLA